MSQKKKKTSKRKWTKNDNILILNYLIETVQNGFQIEKPNSVIFYKIFLEKTGMNATPSLLKNKVRNFRSNYMKALLWSGETGQGIKEIHGEISFEDENNSLSQTIPDKPIELRHFVKLCDQRRKFPVLYKLEFQTAVKVETNSCKHACRKNNEEKNQNQKCIPYDYNRVVLEKMGRTVDSDYINASYVDSLLKPNAYIVTQGPTEETVNDFWRMVWQENVSAIIMLTKTFDFTKVMCMQYWPPALDKQEVYGDIHIGIINEEQLANFQIRNFKIWKLNLDNAVSEERNILQFHYTEWHSHTCPFSNAVLEFRRRVRAVVGNIITANSRVGPMLVHCNDGGGRSGVYCAIDANMELAEEEDCFHVFGYLKKLRQSRKGLIENVDQYKFVYDTLEEHIVCGKTWFSVSELSERLKAKAAKDPVTKMNQYQKEYAQICKQTPRFTIGDCAGGHRADNREKNRDVLCVPPDNFRPYLTSFQGNAFTDYINAVFVDGYTKPREYIVTEWPLKHTVGEFWSLVYDQECSAVVVLLQPPPNSTTYPSFWPEKSKMEKYGPVFSVHSVSRKHYANIKQWEYKINKKIVSLTELMAGVKAPTKVVQLFQLTCFPLGHKVPTSTNSLVALMNMVEQWRAKTDYGPVCVVSPDGRSRAGVYCAANACIEQVIQHGEVDIFQAVKTVRRHRPQLVENMMEYKYCYDLVLHYVLHYLNKDLKEKKFIEFGRGKVIPLTPDSSTDLPNSEICNTGKIVVKKRIPKIEKTDSIQLTDNALRSANGKIMQRKKKGRLYSLGGNEPMKKPRGRLDRLKTVGTFDLGTEMSVLSEVARNLNEKIISGDIDMAGSSGLNRRLSTIPAVSSNDLQGLSTPKYGRREIHESNSSHSSHSSKRNVSKIDGSRNIVNFDQHSSDLNNRKHKFNNSNLATTKNQHSADDCLDKSKSSPNNQKSRSLSSSSCLTKASERTAQINLVNNTLGGKRFSNLKSSNDEPNIVFISIKDSNKIPSIDSPDDYNQEDKEHEHTSTDSNKIELDMRSAEDLNKIDDEITFKNRPRKPMLRKSQRIVRTDSEIFDENIICRNEIVLQTNLDIQIHKEPDYYLNSETTSTTHGSRIASSDIEDICSPKDLQKSTDDSSRNLSTDELDTVFSDTTDLERLDREYRELARSNLQREYKSDGDSLDEVGKKRNEFLKWKNQSFENDFELYNETITQIGDSEAAASNVCSPDGQITSTTNTSENSSTKCMEENKCPKRNSKTYDRDTHSRMCSPKDSDNSTLTSPIRAPSACTEKSSTKSIENTNVRPSKLDVTQNPPAKEGTITSLFEKRFGKIKKINKLLKCKRFSASALYDKKKSSDIELKSHLQKEEKPSKAKSCSPAKTDSKNSIHSSKLSLFHPKSGKSSIFSIRKSPMFSNTSHSNTELNTTSASSTKLNELSKSNFEINKFKSSPSRFSTKRSMKESKNNSTACLYKEQKHSPLSEEFYNKTGSVRLSAMELYEKFCSEDFGGLYKHENGRNTEPDESCGGYKNWHEYRLGHKGLGAAKKYARGKNARLLRQKSEPKFSFRDGSGSRGDISYFPEEEYEDIYEENGNDEGNEQVETDEYEDEYEDEEGDYYEEECEEEEDEDEEEMYNEEHEEIKNMVDLPRSCVSEIDAQEEIIDEDYEAKAYHSEIEDRGDIDLNIGADSDVDEIFLMPAPKTRNYEECGFENKQFTLEQSLLNRSNGIECNLNQLSESCVDNDFLYTGAQDTREIESFGSDEILTIYKICSKDDILNMKDEKIHKTVSAQEYLNTAPISIERAVNEYMKNAPPDIAVDLEPTIYKTDIIARSESFELLSSSSGTIRSGSTLTEYAFDTVRNLNLDSCSTSKLSLSLKSEIFDDFTLTPDEPKVLVNCEFEDFTLTPEGSFSETISDVNNSTANTTNVVGATTDRQNVNSDSLDSEDQIKQDESISSNDVIMIVDKFLANEKLLHEKLNQSYCSTNPSTSNHPEQYADESPIQLNESRRPSRFNFNRKPSLSSTDTDEKFSIVDLDDESIKNVVSAFTSEITKEFDLLFSRAELENDEIIVVEESQPSNDSNTLSVHNQSLPQPQRIPSRYSMQRLEPYFISESEGTITLPLSHSPSTNNEYCKVLDVHDGSFIHKRVISKLKKNRSQSLGNLSNKTRCFPL